MGHPSDIMLHGLPQVKTLIFRFKRMAGIQVSLDFIRNVIHYLFIYLFNVKLYIDCNYFLHKTNYQTNN
jgi:hypothetical protein